MKSFPGTNLLLVSLVFTISLGMTACHQKGCTDPHAINYNITADQDDGSCITCKSTDSQFGTCSTKLVDRNFSSIHYLDTVVTFQLDQTLSTPSDKLCGNSSSSISLKIQSLVGQDMFLEYYLHTYQGPVYISLSKSVVVPAYQTLDAGIVQTNTFPPFFSINLDSMYVSTSSNIIYY